MKIEVRNVGKDELPEVLRVEGEAWPPEIRASESKFSSRMNIFPQGFFAAYVDGVMAAVSTSEMITYPNELLSSWEGITDNGLIEKTHAPSGNALYVVSLGVSSRFQRMGLGSKLIEAQKNLVRSLNLDFLVLGSRIPGYHNHSNIPIEEYLSMEQENGEAIDPEIRFYRRCGLRVQRVVQNYMEDDPESMNYGAVMVWGNK